MNADADADVNAMILMPRFLNCRLPGICQFRMEKKEFAVEMKTFYDFRYLLMHSDFQLQQDNNKTPASI